MLTFQLLQMHSRGFLRILRITCSNNLACTVEGLLTPSILALQFCAFIVEAYCILRILALQLLRIPCHACTSWLCAYSASMRSNSCAYTCMHTHHSSAASAHTLHARSRTPAHPMPCMRIIALRILRMLVRQLLLKHNKGSAHTPLCEYCSS